MIIVKLKGGLGNQLFQYALGRMLAIRNKTELILDIGFFEASRSNPNTTTREYVLSTFPSLKARIAKPDDLDWFESKFQHRNNSLLSKLLNKLNPFQKIVETRFHFNERVFGLKGNLYLEGYWQSEKYFIEIRNTLLNEFIPQISNREVFDTFLNEISECKSVSLHVRRGDYVSDATISAWHGVLSVEYYQEAIDRIELIDDQLHYFVFSDEPQWVEENMNLPLNTYFVSGKGLHQAEELYLMSKCNHNIIANSSYSWWGAWLNDNPNKKVVAPKKWFENNSVDTKDIYSKDWLRI